MDLIARLTPAVLAFATAMSLVTGCRESGYSDLYRDLPFEMDEIPLPDIPSRSVDIRDFGACGDGQTLNTDAFRYGIEYLSSRVC